MKFKRKLSQVLDFHKDAKTSAARNGKMYKNVKDSKTGLEKKGY